MLTSRLMLKYPELHEKFAATRGGDRISVDQQMNCNPYNQGCSGGYPYLVAAYSSFNDLVSQECIEQQSSSSENITHNEHWQCDASKLSGQACKEHFRVKNWHYIGGSLGRCGLHHLCEDAMREELYKGGPLAVSVEPTSGFGYASGVFHGVSGMDDETMLSEVHSSKDRTDCSDTECYAWRKVDHSVLLVGWGEDLSQGKTCQARVHRVEKSEAIPDAGCEKITNEQDCTKKSACIFRGFPYWIIQNSYGPSFGEEGYLRFGPRGQDPMRVEAMTLAADVVWVNRPGDGAEEAYVSDDAPTSSLLAQASVLAEATRHLDFGS
jgi:cathepsin C